MKALSFEITDPHGLHIRPAHDLVQAIHKIQDVNIEIRNTTLPTKIFYHNSNVALSIMSLITAGITKGSTMIVEIADTTRERESGIETLLESLSFWTKIT